MVAVSVYLVHEFVEVCLGQHDRVCKGGELVHGQVLLVDQLGPGDGRHPGEELVASAATTAVLDRLQVMDLGEELGRTLISEHGEGVEPLAAMECVCV